MRKRITWLTMLVVWAALMVGGFGAGQGAGAIAKAEPAHRKGPVREYVCHGTHYKPRSILIACGDGNARVKRLHWSVWTDRKAHGSGVWQQNNCKPDCADGHFINYPVRLRLSQVIVRNHTRIFGRVVALFPGSAPPYPAYKTHRVVIMNHGRSA